MVDKFHRGEKVLIRGVVVNDFTEKLGVVLVDCDDFQSRILGIVPEKLEKENGKSMEQLQLGPDKE